MIRDMLQCSNTVASENLLRISYWGRAEFGSECTLAVARQILRNRTFLGCGIPDPNEQERRCRGMIDVHWARQAHDSVPPTMKHSVAVAYA